MNKSFISAVTGLAAGFGSGIVYIRFNSPKNCNVAATSRTGSGLDAQLRKPLQNQEIRSEKRS
jgi:hypothetical protein